jgi:inosose dehydratase
MFDKEKNFIGIAPIGWTNDDLPELGGEIPFEQCISEMQEAGYEGCEIGNKFPKDPAVLKAVLAQKGLRVANSWFSAYLLTAPFAEVERDFRQKCAFLKATGAKIVGVSEQGNSIQGQDLPVFAQKPVADDARWRTFTSGLNALGKIAKEYGIFMTYHHHMGTVVQTEDEVDRLMSETSEDLVGLLYDTGHLAYCGADYIKVLKKHVKRVKHVHLKDIRPEVVEKVKSQSLSFLDGVKLGAFTVPGDGCIDFASVFSILSNANYQGWLLVEAEQDPKKANPLIYAKRARAYINSLTGL